MSRDKDHIALSDQHNSRGIELADRGWLDEAIREFQKAIELDPRSAHAHDNLAAVHAEKKQWREALREYLAALELEPDSAAGHYNLASFVYGHGLEMAKASLQEAIALDPEVPEAHLTLGRSRDRAPRPELPATNLGTTRLETLVLFRSDLRPGGAVYTPLERFALARPG